MKQKLLKMMLLLCALVVGSSSASATDVTYTFNSKTWAASDGSSSANWTSGKEGNSYNNGVQVTTGVTGANATSPTSFSNVSNVRVYYHTNKNDGVGSIKVKIGTGTEKSFSVTKPAKDAGLDSKYTDFSFSNETGNIKLTVECTTNSVYIESVVITYSSGGGSLTTSDLALTGAPVALSFDLYNNSTPQIINYTTSSTGAVTVSSSSYISSSVDSENKRITITPTAVTPSTQTITVNQAADATYAAGSATFTVSVANSAPVINASNVNIEATATSGTILYTITNPEGGASLSASETEDWISDLTVDSENSRVTFTTTTNTSYVQRTGTIQARVRHRAKWT